MYATLREYRETRFLFARRAGPAISRVMSDALLLDLDGAWTRSDLPLPAVDLTAWGPRLRFSAPTPEMERFRAEADGRLGPARFLVYGSGDFHHLSAVWVRRAARVTKP